MPAPPARWSRLPDAEKPKVDAEMEELTEDLVAHFEDRVSAMDGKAMVVCMSRRICVDLYNQIVALRPD